MQLLLPLLFALDVAAGEEPNGVRLEGHQRVVALADFSYTVRVGTVEGAGNPEDLLVSSRLSGELATAFVASHGPVDGAARRAQGPVEEAGVRGVTAGATGPWRVRVHGLTLPWPEGTLVRVPPDNHPGKQLPVYFAKDLSDELVTVFGVFEDAPPFEMFIAPGQDVRRRESTGDQRVLEVAYTHASKVWTQEFRWVPTPRGVLVVKVQQLEGSEHDLRAVGEAVVKGIAAVTPER